MSSTKNDDGKSKGKVQPTLFGFNKFKVTNKEKKRLEKVIMKL